MRTGENITILCFGEGIFRDIADLKTMAKKNNVALSANGELTKLWKDGLESFSQGKYSQAKAKFEQLDKKISRQLFSGEDDRSFIQYSR